MKCDQTAPTLVLAGLWILTVGLLVWTVRLCSGT
jgi:hypothetical protein